MSPDETKNKIKTFFSSDSTIKGIFISSIASVSALVSFSYAVASTKKRDNTVYDSAGAQLHEAGTHLAVRALKWGTFYAFAGCGLLIFGFWKLANVKDMKEFRQKVGSLFPRVPKNYPPQSKTEFSSVTEFLQYLNDEYSSPKVNGANKVELEEPSVENS